MNRPLNISPPPLYDNDDASATSHDLTIRLLPQNLLLAHATREALDSTLVKQIIQLAFFPSCDAFFSYTETDGDISLILDTTSAEGFPEGTLTVSEDRWRAIEIYEGEAAINEIGIVRRYSEPLAKAGITIIYVSTFNTDLILVQEHLAEQAVTALKAHQTNGIKRSTSKSQLQASTEIAMGSSPPASFKFVSSETDSAASDGNLAVLSQLPYELILACFKRSSISALTHTLLKLLLFPANDDRFFAFTSYGGEVTVIMEKQELDQFGLESVQRITTNNQSWSVIHVQSGPSGVTGTGVVTKASSILARKMVSIFYVSTFSDDFVLVPVGKTEEALACLTEDSCN